MTGGADLFDLNQERVAVAVERDVLDLLHMAASLAFHPELPARAAPEIGLAGFDGFFKRSAVHPGHHQNAARFLFLNNGGNQAVRVEFQLVVKAHGCLMRAEKVTKFARRTMKKFWPGLEPAVQIRTGIPFPARNCFTSWTVYSPK